MSIDELEAKKPVQVSTLPDKLWAEVVSAEIRRDRRGNECLFVRYKTREGAEFTVKYVPSSFGWWVSFLRDIGVNNINQLKGKKIHLVRMVVGREQIPRHYPMEVK